MVYLVKDLGDLLPPTFELLENEDNAFLRCKVCGDETVFACRYAAPLELQAAAARHRRECPFAHGRG